MYRRSPSARRGYARFAARAGARGPRGFGCALVVLALAGAACSSSGGSRPRVTTPAPPVDTIGHAGRWLTDATGRVVTLHGVNMVAKRFPYYPSRFGFGDDDARFLAANGFNAVRLGVIYKAVEPSAGVYDDEYLKRIDGTVATLARYGIRSLLDFHQDGYNEVFGGEGFPDWTVPANQRGPFSSAAAREAAMKGAMDQFWLRDPGPGGTSIQDRYVAALAHVAERFSTNGYVLGYDIINEPLTGGYWDCTKGDCPAFDQVLGTFQQRATAAIRGVDHVHLVWYEPNTLFNWGLPTALPKIDDARVALSFHDYCAPTACDLTLPLKNAELRSVQTGDAIIMTEIGSSLPGVTDAVAAARAHLMSWFVWAYCGCGDPTGSVPPEAEALVFDPRKAPSGRNVDNKKLRVLAEPYPDAVAGTPTQFSFDPQLKDFQLSYALRRADGAGVFGRDACTEIIVPQVQYPNGYKVAVSGARVTSRAGAGTLTLRATGDAPQITVRITPAAKGQTRAATLTDNCASPR
jgi:endoglycosylceramidase